MRNKKKTEFIENLIAKQDEFESEDDKLLLKRTQIAVIRKYNYWKIPFTGTSMAICVMVAMQKSRSLTYRFLPTIVMIPIVSFYHHSIGMYGVHKEIDQILELMAGNEKASEDE